MKLYLLLLAFVVPICGQASAADEFGAVRCGGDIPRALVGRHVSDGRAVAIEARYRDLALKDLGTEMYTDDIYITAWSICGAEYHELIQHDIIRDVLPFPNHSRAAPAASPAPGECQRDGRKMDEDIDAVLDNKAGLHIGYTDLRDETLLPVLFAWRVDLKSMKFVKLDVGGLLCSVSRVYDVDRGP
jgi:hypothetical protein